MTVHSPEYLAATDDEIFLWHHTQTAKNQLELLARGLDPGDESLSKEDFTRKYQGEVLEAKAKKFADLKVHEQKEFLYSAISGEQTTATRQIKDITAHTFTIATVRFFFVKLQQINKLQEWIERSCPFAVFVRLPLEEKQKYHNALVAFHDECMAKAQSPPDRILDSPPAGSGGDPPNFDDPTKWEIIDPA